MEFYKVDLDSIFALVLIFGLIPSFVLTAVIQYLKNRRYKIERQTELMAKMIEKGDSTNLDFKSMAEALQEPTKHGNLKRSVLNNLRWGSIFSFVGLGLLGVALYAHVDGDGGATPWRRDRLPTPVFLCFPGGSYQTVKESTCNAGELG